MSVTMKLFVSNTIIENRDLMGEVRLNPVDIETKFYFEKNVILTWPDKQIISELYNEKNKIIYERFLYGHNVGKFTMPQQYIHMKGIYFLAVNPYSGNNHSHFLSQVFASILLAQNYGIDFSKISIVVAPLRDVHKKLIHLLGIYNILEIPKDNNKAFIFENAIYTDCSFSYYPTIEIATLFSCFREKLSLPKVCCNKKIFISRKDTNRRVHINEDDVIDCMKKRGYTVLELTKMSLLEQIAVFAQAKKVVGTHGAGMSNILFSHDEITFMEIFPKNIVSWWHLQIAYAKNCSISGMITNILQNSIYIHDIPLLNTMLETQPHKFDAVHHIEKTNKSYNLQKIFSNGEHKKKYFSEIDIHTYAEKKFLSVFSQYFSGFFDFLTSYKYDTEGNFFQAMQYAKKACEKEDNYEHRHHLLKLLTKKNDLALFEDLLKNNKEKYENWYEFYNLFARCLESQGKLDKAIEYASKSLEILLDNPWKGTHINIIGINFYMDYPWLLSSIIRNAQLYFISLLRKNGNIDMAIDFIEKTIKTDSHWSNIYIECSYIYNTKGDFEKAINYARKAITMEPYNICYKVHLSNLLCKKKDYNAATALMIEATKLNPYQSEPLIHLANIYKIKGNLDKAIIYARKATKMKPNNTTYKAYFFKLLQKKKECYASVNPLKR